MVGLGLLALDILGSGPAAFGFACTATSPAGLNVQVAPGRIYSLQNVDNSAYSSLAADTAHQILKQGTLPDAITLGCPAPATAGFSINYLVQVAYQDQDTDLAVLPYYNSSNPSVPNSGVGNNGVAQATTRKGVAAVTVKAGTAAATGSQTTPAPDTGNSGLYVVTVANGQSTITSGNISVYVGAPFTSGTCTLNLTGCTTSPTTTMRWVKTNGSLVTAYINSVTAVSNSNFCSFTGLPPNLYPSFGQTIGVASVMNSGATGGGGGLQVQTNGTIDLILNGSNAIWTTSGLKGLPNPAVITWILGS